MTEKEAIQLSGRSLAYLGDAVLEEMVREYLVTSEDVTYGEHPSQKALEFVTAEAQAAAVERLLPLLSETETDVFRRGRNSIHTNVPKHATMAEYRKATGLECLFGFLRLTQQTERLNELFRLGYLAN